MTTNTLTKIFSCGMLGEPTSASRRYQRRISIALTIYVAAMFAVGGIRQDVPESAYVAPFLPGFMFLYVCIEFRRYMAAMDEMLRRIHLESIAWTYLTALVVAMFAGGLASVMSWNVNLMWFAGIEPVRAVWLYATARRY